MNMDLYKIIIFRIKPRTQYTCGRITSPNRVDFGAKFVQNYKCGFGGFSGTPLPKTCW